MSIATFALTILGTFLTRSGVINSVHSFSESSLGPLLIGFFFAVVIVGFGLIAWRGDRLRSPGGIDAPLGREGAFLLNNVVFVGFAFVVLLGTVYPLLYEALTQQQVTVGAPFFDTVAIPVGLTLLFLMAVAPVLSWRKMSGAVLWQRLAIPVWIGVGTVVLCVAFGLRGFATLIGFGLGAMAAATAGRALVLSVRAAQVRHAGWWRGLVGRANGGMIVHLGVVLLAVGIIAATSYRHQAELALHKGTVVRFDGHRFEFEGLRTVSSPSRTAQEAVVTVRRGHLHAGHDQLRWPRWRSWARPPSTPACSTTSTSPSTRSADWETRRATRPSTTCRLARWPSAWSSSRSWRGSGPAASSSGSVACSRWCPGRGGGRPTPSRQRRHW